MNEERELEYAVEEIRALGRRLVSGSWHRNARPMPTLEAIALLAQACGVVVDEGVRRALKEGARVMRSLSEPK